MEVDIEQRIINEYFSLNPVGMPEITVSKVKEKLNSPNEYLIDGFPFTLDLLIQKYRRYIDWHRKKFGIDEKFVKADDKMKTPDEFVALNKFYSSYGTPKGKREYYLFGNFSEDELKAKLNTFLSKYEITPKYPTPLTQQHGRQTIETTESFDIAPPEF